MGIPDDIKHLLTDYAISAENIRTIALVYEPCEVKSVRRAKARIFLSIDQEIG